MLKNFAKNTFFITSAQAMYLLSGYLIHIILVRVISPIEYGIFGSILSLIVLSTIIVERGLPDSISKSIGEGINPKVIREKTGRKHFLTCLVFTVLILVLAPYISVFLNDTGMTTYIRLASSLILIRGMLAYYRAFIDGTGSFGRSSIIILINSVPRLIFLIVFVIFLNTGVTGAIASYILASLIAMLIAFRWSYDYKTSEISGAKYEPLLANKILVFTLCYMVISQIDILYVKALSPNNFNAGYYMSAKTLADIPFFITFAFTFTILPTVAMYYESGDSERINYYLRNILRFMCSFLIPICVIVYITSEALLSFVYTPSYSTASASLGVLMPGLSALSIYVVLSMFMIAEGQVKFTTITSVSLLFLDQILNYFLVSTYDIFGAALALLIVALIGVSVSLIYLSRMHTNFIPYKSLIRISSASLIIATAFLHFEFIGLLLLVSYAITPILFIVLLYFFGEFDNDDIEYLGHFLFKSSQMQD